jgi:hypothetical protein
VMPAMREVSQLFRAALRAGGDEHMTHPVLIG